jgi:hypothetical protein
MARLLHEIWFDADDLPCCLLAGPDGDDARRELLASDGQRRARLVDTFEAASYLEAMEYYHRYRGREPYTSSFPVEDAAPYPEEWLQKQRAALT